MAGIFEVLAIRRFVLFLFSKWFRAILIALALFYAWGAATYFLWSDALPVPVDGVDRSRVISTFGAPRDGGARKHRGVDIFAKRGTVVRAVGWGIVLYKGPLPLGGKVVFTFGEHGLLNYFAHLDDWAKDLHFGSVVHNADPLGVVGDTGNAKGTPPHLHFQTAPMALGFQAVDPVKLILR